MGSSPRYFLKNLNFSFEGLKNNIKSNVQHQSPTERQKTQKVACLSPLVQKCFSSLHTSLGLKHNADINMDISFFIQKKKKCKERMTSPAVIKEVMMLVCGSICCIRYVDLISNIFE